MRKLIGIVSLLLTVALLVMMAGTPSVASAQAGGDPSVAMSLVPPAAQVRIGSPITVKAAFSEPVSGFALGDIAVANGAAGNFSGSDGDSVYTFAVTPDTVGTVTVEIAAGAAQDPGGDGNTAAPLLSLGIPYDDDGDGEISKSEAIASIRDYFADHVAKVHVIGVIRLYFASTGPSAPVSMTLAAEEGHTVDHGSGAQIEIPPGATAETTTVTVSEVDPPESHVDVGKVFDFSIVDATGEEAELQQPVTITLPYHLPKGKTASDVVVLHWDEDLGRWESLDGEAVDEAGQTVSVDTSDLSFLAVAYLLSLTEFVRAGAEALVGGLLEEDYRKGNKHLAGFNGSLGIPPFFKVGASVVFDIDDWLRITAEGLAGYVTSWLNLHGSLGVVSTDQVLPVGISFFAHDRKGSGEDDPRFKPELSALNAEAFVVSGGLKVKKGKIDPAVNLMACSNCLGVSAIDASLNALKGELNLEIHEDIGEDLFAGVEDLNSQVSAGSVASELIGSIWDINVNVAETVVKESFAPFTSYDDPSPDDVDGLIREYYNQFYSVEGGSDITGDGRGDMVFPPEEDADGLPVASIPLVTLFKTDLRETKPYFVEVREVSGGWKVELPNGGTQTNSVEFQPMRNAQVTWHVGNTHDAPDPGRATFRLVKDGVGPLASLLDEIVVSLPKHRAMSDLIVRASGRPGSVAPGGTVTYTVSVTNDGADRAEETALTVGGLSQTGLALRSARTDVTSQHCDASVSGDFLTCVLGDMDDGETLTLTLEFEVVFEPLEPITATLGFHAASQVYDPAPDNNSAEVTTTVQPPTPATPLGGDRVFLNRATMNGKQIDNSNPSLSVTPGQTISGTVGLTVENDHGGHAVFVVEATPTWGDHRSSYWRLPIFVPAFGAAQEDVNINLTAPSAPGTYAIIFAAQAEFSGGYVASATHWPSGSPRWDNGDDIAGWSLSQINFAIANGYVRAPAHGYGPDLAHFGAAAVKIIVSGNVP